MASTDVARRPFALPAQPDKGTTDQRCPAAQAPPGPGRGCLQEPPLAVGAPHKAAAVGAHGSGGAPGVPYPPALPATGNRPAARGREEVHDLRRLPHSVAPASASLHQYPGLGERGDHPMRGAVREGEAVPEGRHADTSGDFTGFGVNMVRGSGRGAAGVSG